jgi:hypothetical protein
VCRDAARSILLEQSLICKDCRLAALSVADREFTYARILMNRRHNFVLLMQRLADYTQKCLAKLAIRCAASPKTTNRVKNTYRVIPFCFGP